MKNMKRQILKTTIVPTGRTCFDTNRCQIRMGQPNIFDMINKGRVEVYIFIFSGYMELENTQELK